MTKKLTEQELLELLKNPENLEQAQKILNQNDEKLAQILDSVDITEDDTLDTLSKKHQRQLTDLVKYFNDKIEVAKQEAVTTARKPHEDAEKNKILEFEKTHPGTKNPEVVEVMQPLYNKGKSLQECYDIACKALDLDPETGKSIEETKDDSKESDKNKKQETKSKETKSAKITSIKSNLATETEEDEDSPKKGENLSLDEALEANMNREAAKFENLNLEG